VRKAEETAKKLLHDLRAGSSASGGGDTGSGSTGGSAPA
jgi:hypothetical protein